MHQSIDNTVKTEALKTQAIDAKIEVFVSEDKLMASVYIDPPQNGGAKPNLKSLNEALAAKNVTYGLDNKILFNICRYDQYNENVLVAQGLEPIAGIDGFYNLHFNANRELKPVEKEDGSMDFYNLGMVENVKKGQLLCTITNPVEGKDGITVTNVKIPYTKGKPVPMLLGKNTEVDENETSIYAAIDGQVEFINGKINVNETVYIKGNIDPSTGNIKVSGNVVISGSVLHGFVVEATGNIQIQGTVSSAKLIAGGSIILQSGVMGGDINCEGDLNSRFIENSNVFVKGDIKADYIMNSDIKCGKSIHATSSFSRIVGGKYVAGKNIVTRTVGSRAGVHTYLEIGTDSYVIERQQQLLKELPMLENKVKSLNNLIDLLRQFEASNRLTPEKKQMLDEGLYSYEEINNSYEAGKKELEQISELIKNKGYGRITCTDTIHHGSVVRIGEFQITIREDMKWKSFYHTDEGIHTGDAK